MDTDRNLLFGVLALQADLIDAEQFARACSDWAAHKERPLADLLVERGWLTAEDRADVERLLERKLKKHKGDARASLAEVASDPVKRSLADLADPDVRQTLAGLASPPPQGLVLLSLATTALSPGSRDRYTLSRLHATGGIGRVWLARDASLGRDVALKELRPEAAGHPAVWARFLREAQVTGQLEHPGIVPIYEVGQRPDGQQPFYTMRFVRGRTLAEAATAYHQRRARGEAGPLELRELLTAFVGVCNAVAYAHSRGVLHRDLKPQNVVLGDYGEVIVLDWGLARVLGRADGDAATLHLPVEGAPGATIQGQVLGTPAYMAPEQAEGRLDLLGPATDVYGLGAILYELLTGQPPFTGGETAGVLRRVIHEAPARPRSLEKGAPPALEAVCLKALAKKPGQRYATAKELADEVRHWLADEPVRAYREPLPVRTGRWARRHRTGVAVAAALLVASVAALGVSTVLVNRQRARAEANFQLARTAVDDMYTQVAEKWLAQEARMEPVQREFLVKALRFYEQSAQPTGSSAEVRLEAGKAARRVGAIQYRLGDSAAADAEAAHGKSLPLREAVAREDPTVENREAAGRSHYHFARFLQRVGRFRAAEAEYGRAVAQAEALAADVPRVPRPRVELANDLIEEATLRTLLGREKEAEADLRRGLELAEALQADFPSVGEYRELQAAIRRDLAGLLNERRQTDDARKAYRAAVADGEALVRECPEVLSYRWNLAVHLSGLMSLEWGAGRFGEAEAAGRRALELAEGIAAAAPARVDYRALAAQRRFQLADLLSDLSRKGEANSVYERALAGYESLVRDCPPVPDYRHAHTQLLTHVGDRRREEGNLEAAEAAYDRTLTLAEALARDLPEVPCYRIAPAAVRTSLAKLAVRRGDVARARGLLEPSLRDLDAEQKLRPADGHVRSYQVTNLGYFARVQAREGDARAAAATAGRMEELARGPVEHFNCACYLSLLFKDVQGAAKPGPDRDALTRTLPGRALAQLRKAREAGMRDVGVMLGDADFDPIRTREEFQALCREVSPDKK
jgi:serine/threonine-protein kinase